MTMMIDRYELPQFRECGNCSGIVDIAINDVEDGSTSTCPVCRALLVLSHRSGRWDILKTPHKAYGELWNIWRSSDTEADYFAKAIIKNCKLCKWRQCEKCPTAKALEKAKKRVGK